MSHPRTVSGQIRALGHHVEAGKQGDPLVKDQVHDMALTFLPDELESQQGADGLFGRDHAGFGQLGLADDLGQIEAMHQRDEEQQAAHSSSEGAGRKAQGADIGHGRWLGLECGGPLVIAAPGKSGKPFFAQQHGECIDTDGVSGSRQLPLNVIDGEVLLADGHGQFTDAIPRGGGLRPVFNGLEEAHPFARIVAELMAEHAKGAGGIVETAGHFGRRQLLDEEAAQGLVLPLERRFWGKEELGFGRVRYPITSIHRHNAIMLSQQTNCQDVV